jgi:hypothetical protein
MARRVPRREGREKEDEEGGGHVNMEENDLSRIA